MSNSADGRGLATDEFDDDEIDWDDEGGPNDQTAKNENVDDEDGLSPIESLVDAGSDIFDGDDDDPEHDSDDDLD
jgi:hypothetical protein